LHFPQSWPIKPVRIIVPFPAGGGTDIQARLLSNEFVSKLNTEIRNALSTQEIKKFFQREIEKYARVIKAANITVQ